MTGESTISGADFKDRKTGLVVFGIMEIIFGALCFLLMLVMIFGLLAASALAASSAQPMSAGMMIPGILVYVLLAAWFIWMGIGSLQARRWARALWLVASWIWLISGIIGMVTMLMFLPGMYDQMGKNEQIPLAVTNVIKYLTFGFMVVFYIIIPGVLILFYGSRHVKATCERHDPRVRWTDKCPLPVLALSIMCWFWAACLPFLGFYGWAIPFFGVILQGLAGAAVALIGMLLLGYVARGIYRLRASAWGCAVGLVIAWGLSSGITFARVSLMEFYEKMNFPAEQLELIKSFALMPNSTMVILIGIWVAVILAYLLYTRRFFARPPEQSAGSGIV